jgi:hypothetical protein
MLTRYIALMDRLVTEGYDAIVIVAHSQGTVLTADLLRWRTVTKHRPLPGNRALPIYFLSMGSPLTQLYATRFPDLYDWVCEGSATDLGLKAWVNVYRSGDYVGRTIWKRPEDAAAWEYQTPRLTEALSSETGRAEFCIGEGAHTHYWDETAPEVRGILDQLIQEAARNVSANTAL